MMTDQNGQATKDIDSILDNTIQSRTTSNNGTPFSILSFLYRAGELISPWWSRQRDIDLHRFYLESDHFKAAIYKVITKFQSIQPRVEPRDATIKASIRRADMFNQILLEDSEFGQGWIKLIEKGLLSLFIRDNGMFWEVIGDGPKDGPIRGPALGLANLDPTRCTRTGNVDFPVVYLDTDGKSYALNRRRVVFTSQSPVDLAKMNDVGLCWISRAINIAQTLVDIYIYKQEKLGSRPQRQMLIGKGVSAEQIWSAIVMGDEQMDNANLRRYAKNVVIGSQTNTDIDVLTRDLNGVPDGFDEQTAVELAMFAIALAGGFPPRDLWPATTTGATKADAMYQHVGGSAGYEAILDQIALMLGGPMSGSNHRQGKFLPPDLKLVFDLVDDEQDARHAEVSKMRSESAQIRLLSGVTDVRTEREKALAASDLTQPQFDELELNDGRLPDGNSVLTLFVMDDSRMQSYLDIGIDDPLNVEANRSQSLMIIDAIDEKVLMDQAALANAGWASQLVMLRQAIAALEALRKLYIDTETEQPEADPVEEAPAALVDLRSQEPDDEQPPPDDELKQVTIADDLEELLGDLPPEAEDYFDELSGLIEAAQTGDLDEQSFLDEATELTIAVVLLLFLLGSGKTESELTSEDREVIRNKTDQMLDSIGNLGTAVYDGSFQPVEDDGGGHSMAARAFAWASVAAGAFWLGSIWGAPDTAEFRWVFMPGKKHCKQCAGLNGQIKTAAEWRDLARQGIYPRSWDLQCKGIYCGCSLTQVKQRKLSEVFSDKAAVVPVLAQQANYRHGLGTERTCKGCGYQKDGYCQRFRFKVDGKYTCDDWGSK